MNIAGRIIQNRNIFENDSETFFAKYKGHDIHASLFVINIPSNNEYSYTIIKKVVTKNGGNNKSICSGVLQRCEILDVVTHALNISGL